MKNLNNHIISFRYKDKLVDLQYMDMAFGKDNKD